MSDAEWEAGGKADLHGEPRSNTLELLVLIQCALTNMFWGGIIPMSLDADYRLCDIDEPVGLWEAS